MTTQDLTRAALPYARHALKAARPAVIEAVGRAGWIVLWPAWAVVTGPMLEVVVRIAVELAVGLTAPQFLPILEMVNAVAKYLSEQYLTGPQKVFLVELAALMKTPRGALSAPVRAALALPAGLQGDADTDTGPGGGEV